MRKRITRAVVAAAAVTLVAGALAATPAQAGTSRTHSRLVEKTSKPATRVPGSLAQPGSIVSANVVQDIVNGRTRATVVLSGPSSSAGRLIEVGFGYYEGGTCQPQERAAAVNHTGSNTTVRIDQASATATQLRWDCALVLLSQNAGERLDGVFGLLANGQAQLRVSIPDGRNVKRKKWQTVTFRVSNPGNAATTGVRLKVAGKGVKFRKKSLSVGTIAARSSKNVKVRVRVNSKTDRNLTGTVTSTHVSSVWTTTKLQPTYKRKKASPGRYKGSSKITFTLTKNRQIKKFKGRLTVRCGAYPSYSYYTAYYSVPTTKVSKKGRVNKTHKRSGHSVELRGVFDGKTLRSGEFTYSAKGCSGHTAFTAKRR